MIRLHNVSKTYAVGTGVRALRNVNLSVAANDYLAIVGPSGSGKSTMLHLLGLLDTPSEGSVFFDGIETSKLGDADVSRLRGESIGFVFQFFHLIPHLTVTENVQLPLFYRGLPPRERRKRAEAVLEEVGLSHRLRHRPRQLSGGESQRAAIARALVTRPRMILADEPTGNLDSRSGADILALFDKVHREGRALVVITHDAAVAGRIPRRVSLTDGRIVEGTAP